MASTPGLEPEPHRWGASALTTATCVHFIIKAIVSLMHEGESKLMVLYLDVNFSLVFVIALVDYSGLFLICPPKSLSFQRMYFSFSQDFNLRVFTEVLLFEPF